MNSGVPLEAVYGPDDGEFPGEYPYTRGPYASMYRSKLWTMRMFAGFGTAEATNERWRLLLAGGGTGLSCAFDLPTQMGYDSDHPLAHGEVGKVGVAIDSIDDMRILFDGIPLDKVSTSMTINAPAAVLLLMYQLVGEEQGVAAGDLNGTIQNDVLKEYIARGTYIYPPQASLRLITDIFGYCRAEIPKWNTISISGYHMAEAGATPVQEVAFTLADGMAGEPLGKELPPGVLMAIGVRNCGVLLDSGFTGYVGAACGHDIDASLKLAIAQGIMPGPRIRACSAGSAAARTSESSTTRGASIAAARSRSRHSIVSALAGRASRSTRSSAGSCGRRDGSARAASRVRDSSSRFGRSVSAS